MDSGLGILMVQAVLQPYMPNGYIIKNCSWHFKIRVTIECGKHIIACLSAGEFGMFLADWAEMMDDHPQTLSAMLLIKTFSSFTLRNALPNNWIILVQKKAHAASARRVNKVLLVRTTLVFHVKCIFLTSYSVENKNLQWHLLKHWHENAVHIAKDFETLFWMRSSGITQWGNQGASFGGKKNHSNPITDCKNGH